MIFKGASQAYKSLTEEEKKKLNTLGGKRALSGFNMFMKRYMNERKEKQKGGRE